MESVGGTCVPQEIAQGHKHKSKWGLLVMTAFDIPTGDALVEEALSPEDITKATDTIHGWRNSTMAALSGNASKSDVEEEFVNCCETACPLDAPDVNKYTRAPRYPTYTTAARGVEKHNLWHPDQFIRADAGHVTCTLCGITISSGQEATHGRGLRHSVKAQLAGKKPIAQCRGFKWCCWYGCSCGQWHTRSR
jgi:hypothetical protein